MGMRALLLSLAWIAHADICIGYNGPSTLCTTNHTTCYSSGKGGSVCSELCAVPCPAQLSTTTVAVKSNGWSKVVEWPRNSVYLPTGTSGIVTVTFHCINSCKPTAIRVVEEVFGSGPLVGEIDVTLVVNVTGASWPTLVGLADTCGEYSMYLSEGAFHSPGGINTTDGGDGSLSNDELTAVSLMLVLLCMCFCVFAVFAARSYDKDDD